MPRPTNPHVADMNGPVALPRSSGELVFHDPWERRVFAMAVALCEQGLYQWEDFRDHLIAEIAAGAHRTQTDPTHPAEPSYYESWLAAFEKLLIDKGICTKEQLDALKAA